MYFKIFLNNFTIIDLTPFQLFKNKGIGKNKTIVKQEGKKKQAFL